MLDKVIKNDIKDRDLVVYVLCGLPGSGKTTYALCLQKNNEVELLSLDRQLIADYGKDFSPEKYHEFEMNTKSKLIDKAEKLLNKGISICFDWGFWKKQERIQMKNFAEKNNARYKLVYFERDKTDSINSIINRDKDLNHVIDQEMFEIFSKEFEKPDSSENPTIFIYEK